MTQTDNRSSSPSAPDFRAAVLPEPGLAEAEAEAEVAEAEAEPAQAGAARLSVVLSRPAAAASQQPEAAESEHPAAAAAILPQGVVVRPQRQRR